MVSARFGVKCLVEVELTKGLKSGCPYILSIQTHEIVIMIPPSSYVQTTHYSLKWRQFKQFGVESGFTPEQLPYPGLGKANVNDKRSIVSFDLPENRPPQE